MGVMGGASLGDGGVQRGRGRTSYVETSRGSWTPSMELWGGLWGPSGHSQGSRPESGRGPLGRECGEEGRLRGGREKWKGSQTSWGGSLRRSQEKEGPAGSDSA